MINTQLGEAEFVLSALQKVMFWLELVMIADGRTDWLQKQTDEHGHG